MFPAISVHKLLLIFFTYFVHLNLLHGPKHHPPSQLPLTSMSPLTYSEHILSTYICLSELLLSPCFCLRRGQSEIFSICHGFFLPAFQSLIQGQTLVRIFPLLLEFRCSGWPILLSLLRQTSNADGCLRPNTRMHICMHTLFCSGYSVQKIETLNHFLIYNIFYTIYLCLCDFTFSGGVFLPPCLKVESI